MKTDFILPVYDKFVQGAKVNIDSRQICEGDIFIALKGENFDGNKFAEKAIANGACIAIVDNAEYANGGNVILVDDSLLFLQSLANYHRRQLSIPIIGLTGSNGKTTTKELVCAALSSKYNVLATKGNLNNHIGVPLTLLSITKQHQVAIIEMGANHIGEIATLCSIAMPTHGLITNIGRAHLDGFGSFEGVIKAKTELYGYLKQTNGTAFYNDSNSILQNSIAQFELGKNSVEYGVKINNAVAKIEHDSRVSVAFTFNGANVSIKTNLTGIYNLENVLAAYSIARYFSVPSNAIVSNLESFLPTNSRSQLINRGSNDIVLDAYNANPSSMDAALRSFSEIETEKSKVVLVGNMLELGNYSAEEHEKVVDLCLQLKFDKVILVGENYPRNKKGTIWFQTSILCAEFLKTSPLINSLVLLKGSRGAKMEELLEVI